MISIFLRRFSSTASISNAQLPPSNQFAGCDFYQTMELNQWYDVFSPQFPRNYLPNTFCRWTACAPYGSVVIVNCTVMKIPAVSMRHVVHAAMVAANTQRDFILFRLRSVRRLFGRISLNIAVAIVLKSLYRVAKI